MDNRNFGDGLRERQANEDGENPGVFEDLPRRTTYAAIDLRDEAAIAAPFRQLALGGRAVPAGHRQAAGRT